MKQVRVVAGLLVRPGPVFLAQQRLAGGPRGGLWELPGGKVEPGESEPDALRRELLEELGVEVAVGARLAESVHAYPDLHVALSLYRCTSFVGEPRPLQAQALTWGSARALAALPFGEADLPFLPLLAKVDAP